jgi:hypothetical protein
MRKQLKWTDVSFVPVFLGERDAWGEGKPGAVSLGPIWFKEKPAG